MINEVKSKKSIWKKWWFWVIWVIIGFILLLIIIPEQPTLRSIESPTYQSPILVEGYNVKPSAQVIILLNGEEYGKINADQDGKFSLEVALKEGENVLQVTSIYNGETRSSLEKKVRYIIKELSLEVFEPKTNTEVENPQIVIKGKTDIGAKVMIQNNEVRVEVKVNENGNFEQEIKLLIGENQIQIVADNSRKQKTLLLNVKLLSEQEIAERKAREARARKEEEIRKQKIQKEQLKNEIRTIAESKLSGKNNMGEPYIRKIEVIEQIGGGYGVFVEYNADDSLTIGLRKRGIELKMGETYHAFYTSGKDITTASIAAYFPLTDKYGNTEAGVVYKTRLDRTEADKINWNQDSAYLHLEIIPGVWTTTILHPEFR